MNLELTYQQVLDLRAMVASAMRSRNAHALAREVAGNKPDPRDASRMAELRTIYDKLVDTQRSFEK